MGGGECTLDLRDVKNVGVKALETFCIHDARYYRCNISQGKHSYQYVTNMCQFVSIQSMDRVYTYEISPFNYLYGIQIVHTHSRRSRHTESLCLSLISFTQQARARSSCVRVFNSMFVYLTVNC